MNYFKVVVLVFSLLFFSVNVFAQTKVQKPTKRPEVKSDTNFVTNENSSVITNVIERSMPSSGDSQGAIKGSVSTLPIEIEVKPTSSVPEAPKGIEYIKAYTKEKGVKVYAEFGGGPMVTGGIVWRLTPIFGVGIGGGYTPPPYRNFGPVLDLKAEFVPMYFFIVEDELKMNVLSGLRGVFFFGSMTQYMSASVGVEFLIRVFQYIVPSFNVYLYLAGREIIPQLSFQMRIQF